MREAEQRGLAYLFKLRLTANVKRMLKRLVGAKGVERRRPGLAGQGERIQARGLEPATPRHCIAPARERSAGRCQCTMSAANNSCVLPKSARARTFLNIPFWRRRLSRTS